MYLNKVILIGNLTKAPELKAMPSGGYVCNLSMATNRVWKDQNGQKQEQVEYHNIVVFGKQAESVAQYMAKGSQMCIEGRIQTRSWDNQEGVKQYRTEIVAENIQFGAKRTTDAPARTETKVDTSESQLPDEEINPEDIPF